MIHLRSLAALAFATLAPTAGSAAAPRPNILIVLVDDAGYGDFSCHGHPFLQTPHIDRLHAESIRLTDFHVAPMCSPTRGQLLTGVHGLRTGVTSVTSARTYLRPEFATAPQIFAAAGWRTGLFGKWHLGDSYPHRPMDKGFQTAVWLRGWGFTSAPEFSNTLIAGTVQRGEKAEQFPGYITDFCFDEAMAWMRACQAKAEPFFCYVPLNAAHAPHIVPEKYLAAFAGKPAPAFFGMLANLDENMGRLETFLRTTGLRENTLVIFMTDNGGTAGVKTYNAGLRAGKTTYYEGGHRVPCFIRWPAGGLRAPADLTPVTQVQDVLPTLLEFADLTKPAGPDFDGLSLAPLLRGKTAALPDRTLVVQYGPGAGQKDTTGPKKFQSAVLWKQWRLVHGTELYDVYADRAQTRDLAPSHPEVVADLRRRYENWWATVAPRLNEFVPASLGAAAENPVLLTSSDWQDAYADNAGHVRHAVGGPRGGPWHVQIERTGDYTFALRRWPFDRDAPLAGNITPPGKALPIASATLTVAGQKLTAPAEPQAKEVVFRTRLPAGRTPVQAWFQDAAGTDLCGAYYVKVTRLDR